MNTATRTPLLLEIVVDSPELAQAAEEAGADRLELCSRLELGGITPDVGMMEQVRSLSRLPIHVMIRPREGDFLYTPEEFTEMKEQIRQAKLAGVDGVVFGILGRDSRVDVERNGELAALSAPLAVTFHRAFDQVADRAQGLEEVIRCGAKRILTSGGAESAAQGTEQIRGLVERAGTRLTILPGGGIHKENVEEVWRKTGAREIHSGLGSAVPYLERNLREFQEQIRAMKEVLRSIGE